MAISFMYCVYLSLAVERPWSCITTLKHPTGNASYRQHRYLMQNRLNAVLAMHDTIIIKHLSCIK